MSRKPTMEDVKNLAGVSISTVSRVINGTRKVSPEKTEAVNRAIQKLGYKPNELARSLVMKKSNTIGIILDDIGYEYMAQYIRGIDEIGKMYRYDILLYSTFGDFETQKKAVEFLSSKQVEGIIVISEKINNEILYSIKEYEIPYILLDTFYSPDEFKTVSIDYKEAMKSLTDYYAEKGHKNLCYVKTRGSFSASELKENGFNESVEKNSLEAFVFSVEDNLIENGYKFMENNINKLRNNNITGILAESDSIALGVLHYCYDNDIKVPDEFSVSGFGNTEISSLYRPSLTTVRLPYYDIGAIAVRVLIKMIGEELDFNQSVSLNHEIMKRDTVK